MNSEIRVGELISTIEYDYPTFHLSMQCYWAEVISGELEPLEALDTRWLTKEMLNSVEWLPADITLVETVKSQMSYLPFTEPHY